MRFQATRLQDVKLIALEPVKDERGYFARTFCVHEFAAAGLATAFVQGSVSRTLKTGTLRGMHFQRAPHEEVKLIRCLVGAIHDVLLDIRPTSPTYMQWESYRLSAGDGLQLYVPCGFAHGFQTLEPETEISYLMTEFYSADASDGIRYDDPAFNISWPMPVTDISAKDVRWPDFSEKVRSES